MVTKDKPTGHTLTYRGHEYEQWTHKNAEYPANMWLTYRTIRYRPATFKYRKEFARKQVNNDCSTLVD